MSYRQCAKHQCPACGLIKMELVEELEEADPPWLRSPAAAFSAVSFAVIALGLFAAFHSFEAMLVESVSNDDEIARLQLQIHELRDESNILNEQVTNVVLEQGWLENETTRLGRDIYLISHPTVWREMEGQRIFVNPWWSCVAVPTMRYTCVNRESGRTQHATRGEVRELMRGIDHSLVGRRLRRQPDSAFWERRAR
jgi:FtsZ-binding cell division protein ZapB